MKKSRTRKGHGIIRLTLIVSLTAILTVVIGTFAYSESLGQADNYIAVGIFKVDLIDIFENNKLTLPGDTVNKDVSMINNGTRDAVVRIRLDPSWTPPTDAQANELLTSVVTVTYGPTAAADWTMIGGWYYYNKILKPGETTSLLVDALFLQAVSNDLHAADYSGAAYNLSVLGESLQAMNDAAVDTWAVEFEIDGENLIWTAL
jgi:hypothetical protein